MQRIAMEHELRRLRVVTDELTRALVATRIEKQQEAIDHDGA